MSFLTKIPTNTWKFGEKLFALLAHHSDQICPELIGSYEPINDPVSDIEGVKFYWQRTSKLTLKGNTIEVFEPVYWERVSALRGKGIVRHARTTQNGELINGYIQLKYTWSNDVNWLCLFKDLVRLTGTDFAFLDRIVNEASLKLENPGSFNILNGSGFGDLIDPYLDEPTWGIFLGQRRMADFSAIDFGNKGTVVEEFGSGTFAHFLTDFNREEYGSAEWSQEASKMRENLPETVFTPPAPSAMDLAIERVIRENNRNAKRDY